MVSTNPQKGNGGQFLICKKRVKTGWQSLGAKRDREKEMHVTQLEFQMDPNISKEETG